MKENIIIKIALTCILAGLPMLYYFSQSVEITSVAIDKIDEVHDSIVEITGFVQAVEKKDGLTIIKLTQKNTIDVVVFDDADFVEGTEVTVKGRIDDYKGKNQIVAEEVHENI